MKSMERMCQSISAVLSLQWVVLINGVHQSMQNMIPAIFETVTANRHLTDSDLMWRRAEIEIGKWIEVEIE